MLTHNIFHNNVKTEVKHIKNLTIPRFDDTIIASCGCGGMADAPDLGSGDIRRGGSSPFIRTIVYRENGKATTSLFICKNVYVKC